MGFKNLFIKIKGNKELKISAIDNLVSLGQIFIGDNTIYRNLKVNIRKKDFAKTFLTIGNDSVINGDFIFENENGIILIGDRTFIGGGGKFISINNIQVGNDVLISWGCTLMDNNAHSLKWSERENDVLQWKRGIEENKIGEYKSWESVKSAPIIIEDKTWIGFEVVILKGVTIGEGAIVGSRSVVTKDVPAWTIVAGNPAKVVRTIPESER
jgi:acetyltransferase-like isoleucine patch superfamily enzyme